VSNRQIIEAEVYARVIEAIKHCQFGPNDTAEDARAFLIKSLGGVLDVMRIQGVLADDGAADVSAPGGPNTFPAPMKRYVKGDGNLVTLTAFGKRPEPGDAA